MVTSINCDLKPVVNSSELILFRMAVFSISEFNGLCEVGHYLDMYLECLLAARVYSYSGEWSNFTLEQHSNLIG